MDDRHDNDQMIKHLTSKEIQLVCLTRIRKPFIITPLPSHSQKEDPLQPGISESGPRTHECFLVLFRTHYYINFAKPIITIVTWKLAFLVYIYLQLVNINILSPLPSLFLFQLTAGLDSSNIIINIIILLLLLSVLLSGQYSCPFTTGGCTEQPDKQWTKMDI